MRAGPEDRFDASDDSEEGRSRRGVVRIVVAAVAVVAFGVAVWYAYTLGARSGSPSDVPLVTAEPGPWKKRPEDPGGLKVANQDKTVFDRLEPELAEPKEERLLPPPEEPMERPPPLPTGSQMQADTTSPASPDPASPEGETGTEAAEATDAEPTSPQPTAEAASTEAPEQVASLPPATATPPADGGYRIQIAALRSETDARREWQRIQSANQDLLGNLQLNVERADLGERGVFYRLQAGPLEDKALADLLCGKLKGRNLGCLVVAR